MTLKSKEQTLKGCKGESADGEECVVTIIGIEMIPIGDGVQMVMQITPLQICTMLLITSDAEEEKDNKSFSDDGEHRAEE